MKYIRPLFALLLLALCSAAVEAQTINKDNLRSGPKVVQAFHDVVAKPSQAVVRVLANGKEKALGTIIDPDGWIITKASVLDPQSKIVCKFKDGKEVTAKYVGVDDSYDLALLKIDAKELPTVRWGNSKEAWVGRWVASAGPGPEPVAIGVVSVATRKYVQGDQGPKNANSNSGWLGVGLDQNSAKITAIFPGSPAQKAGLKKDDLVLEAAGKKIIDTETLINTIGRHRPGDEVSMKIKRGEEQLDFKVTLKKRPPDLFGNPQETMGSKLSDRRGGFPEILQHDTILRPSDCGGPLVDLDGKTVGINIARAGRTETYAIPAEEVQKVAAKLKTGEFAPKEEISQAEPAVKISEPLLRVTNSITSKDGVTNHRPGKPFMKAHEMKMAAGVTYVITMDTTDKGFDPYLILEDPKGKLLAEDDDSGGQTNAKIVFRAPSDGTYRIIATAFAAEQTGNYTLTVRKQLDAPK